MINILFFGQTRELVGENELVLNIDSMSVLQLKNELITRGEKWQFALIDKTVLCAVNQTFVDEHFIIHDNDEVAFFPPVTGG